MGKILTTKHLAPVPEMTVLPPPRPSSAYSVLAARSDVTWAAECGAPGCRVSKATRTPLLCAAARFEGFHHSVEQVSSCIAAAYLSALGILQEWYLSKMVVDFRPVLS